jgi:hypothetical protein
MKWIAAVALVAACAHDVRTHFPTPDGESPGDTGSFTLVLTHPSELYLAVDGTLVVDGKNTSRVHVDGLPAGYASLAIAMGDGEKQQQVWIEPGHDTVLPIGSPGGSPYDSVRNMILSLAAIAIYAWIK